MEKMFANLQRIGYLILTTALTAIDATLNMSVFAGIISGIDEIKGEIKR